MTYLSAGEIASLLGVSPNTVRTQIRGVYNKFGVDCRSDAMEYAFDVGLLTRPPALEALPGPRRQ